MKPRIWIEMKLYPDELARLKSHADVVENGTLENLPDSDVAVIGASQVDAAFIDRAGPRLKMAIRHGIGFNNVDVPTASARGVLTANTPDGPTESTAEHAVALMLAMTKRVVKADRMLRQKQPWTRDDLRGLEVRDHLLGVVGYGRIGRRVTEICALGLKMKVIVYDPYVSGGTRLPEGVRMTSRLDEVLSQADVVTIHIPLSQSTRHLIGERELKLMKPDAYLVNASRGPVVDEAALIRVLREGHLAGAGLDVFEIEPPEADNPLLQMDNVVATPHTAGNTSQASQRSSQGVVDQILQLLAGEKPSFLLDPDAWPGRAKK